MAKPTKKPTLPLFTPKQWVWRSIITASLLANAATVIALIILNSPQADFWITNKMINRNCVRDLDFNLAHIDSDERKALYSVTVCGGYNYKTKTYDVDGIKAMMDKIKASN